MVEDIIAKSNECNGVSFIFARRKCNAAAHSIAKLALSLVEVLTWMEDCPNEALAAVILDKYAIE